MKILSTLISTQDFIKIANPKIYIQHTGINGVLGSRGPTDTVYNSIEKRLFMGVLRNVAKIVAPAPSPSPVSTALLTEEEMIAISAYGSTGEHTTVHISMNVNEYIRLLTIVQNASESAKPIEILSHSLTETRGVLGPYGRSPMMTLLLPLNANCLAVLSANKCLCINIIF